MIIEVKKLVFKKATLSFYVVILNIRCTKFLFKTSTLRGGCWKRGESRKTDTEGGLPKNWAWTVCRFKRELGKKEGMVFLRGLDIPMHTIRRKINSKKKNMCEISIIILFCKKLESVEPVQQKIKLPSPY